MERDAVLNMAYGEVVVVSSGKEAGKLMRKHVKGNSSNLFAFYKVPN